jgi:hypothetical protein
MDDSRRRVMMQLLSISALAAPALFAPGRYAVGADTAQDGIICTLHGPNFGLPHDTDALQPDGEAVHAVSWISDIVGIRPNFSVGQAVFQIKNGAYALLRDGERRIVYDTEYFSWVEGSPNWRETGIMAHEVGHHIAGHTAGVRPPAHDRELEADRFAGFALARLGATLEQAIRWVRSLSEKGSDSHPPRRQRLMAVTNGWRHGRSAL